MGDSTKKNCLGEVHVKRLKGIKSLRGMSRPSGITHLSGIPRSNKTLLGSPPKNVKDRRRAFTETRKKRAR